MNNSPEDHSPVPSPHEFESRIRYLELAYAYGQAVVGAHPDLISPNLVVTYGDQFVIVCKEDNEPPAADSVGHPPTFVITRYSRIDGPVTTTCDPDSLKSAPGTRWQQDAVSLPDGLALGELNRFMQALEHGTVAIEETPGAETAAAEVGAEDEWPTGLPADGEMSEREALGQTERQIVGTIHSLIEARIGLLDDLPFGIIQRVPVGATQGNPPQEVHASAYRTVKPNETVICNLQLPDGTRIETTVQFYGTTDERREMQIKKGHEFIPLTLALGREIMSQLRSIDPFPEAKEPEADKHGKPEPPVTWSPQARQDYLTALEKWRETQS